MQQRYAATTSDLTSTRTATVAGLLDAGHDTSASAGSSTIAASSASASATGSAPAGAAAAHAAPATARRVQRVRHELHRRDVQVQRVDAISPGFVSVTFHDPSLPGFVSDGFDDHVKFMLPGADGDMVRRDYTPRAFDRAAGTLTIEFALHGHGAASDWARQAAPGQRATIGGPKGSMVVPTDYAWHLLAGDATALPAIHRRLGELPAGTSAIAIVQLDNDADRRDLRSAASLDLLWVRAPAELVAAMQALQLPAGDGHAWCAGEAATMASLRDLLRDKQHPREAMRVAAYWKRGASDFHENLDA